MKQKIIIGVIAFVVGLVMGMIIVSSTNTDTMTFEEELEDMYHRCVLSAVTQNNPEILKGCSSILKERE